MPITETTIVQDRPQVSGSRRITERHVDNTGAVQLISYIGEAGVDALAVAQGRVPQLNQFLVDREIERDIQAILEGRYEAVTSVHATIADVRAALRTFYQNARGNDVGRMAGYLLTLTDAVLRTLFNMTQAQVTSLRTRLQARFDALNTVLAAAGE
jgi:hypothetical protein